MGRKGILIFGVIAVFVTALFLRGRVHYVDDKPSIAEADKYFSELKQARLDSAFGEYSANFRHVNERTWRDLLTGLQGRYGVVRGFNLVESKIVPVAEVGCTFLRYRVSRSQLSTEESLILCPDRSSHPTIVGHELVRDDTHQMISAGVTILERGIHVP
ncbi:MAG: hypothetical protein ACLPXB_17865 [Thiobacillaceae bacterium]